MSDIIRMAREAGFHCYNGCVDGIDADLERFAALVAAAERESTMRMASVKATVDKRGPVAWLPPDPPPECQTEAEKTAFAFGWFKALEAQREQPAQPELAPIYYMRDNHTFKKLSADVNTALVEIEHEFNEGYTYGALCSKREGFQDVHASGSKKRLEFFAECKTTLEKWLPTSPPAQPQQEPVAWDNCRGEKQCRSWCGNSACGSHWNGTSPPAQQQEPVAWYCKEGLNQGVSLKQESPDWEPLYTTKFNFKPLTDEEADELVRRFARYELLRAIEAKLREKNQ